MIKNGCPISDEIQEQIVKRVSIFNEKNFAKTSCKYYPEIRGKFIYLMRTDDNISFAKICRLTYNGNLEDMDFAIFKYSSETYAPSECDFPGYEFVDGTIEGAMKAGLEAY